MEYIVSTEEMYRFDQYTSSNLHIPEAVLMERAALGVYTEVLDILSDYTTANTQVLVLCGYGNNGGDGLAVGRLLYCKGISVRIVLVGNSDKASESNKLQQSIITAYQEKENTRFLWEYSTDEADRLIDDISEKSYGVIIDALFGVGLKRKLNDEYQLILDKINAINSYKIAVDIPTGINADGNMLCDRPFMANMTLTFGFKKIGHIIYPSCEFCGEVKLCEMGIDNKSIAENYPQYGHITALSDVKWPKRQSGANKGTYGKLCIIAGNKDIFGALLLSVGAAFATGVGMIMVITHENNKSILADKYPEVMLKTYTDKTCGEEIEHVLLESEKWCDGFLVGPGIGKANVSRSMVDWVINKSTKPVLFDADAINIISETENFKEMLFKQQRIVILTPHIMEFSRLSGVSVQELKKNYLYETRLLAQKLKSIIICKDAVSVIADSEQKVSFLNDSGNDGMATAGSGDVLAGICSVLMLQMDDAFEAAVGGSYIHGIAGCMAAKTKGIRGMTASDIVNELQELWPE